MLQAALDWLAEDPEPRCQAAAAVAELAACVQWDRLPVPPPLCLPLLQPLPLPAGGAAAQMADSSMGQELAAQADNEGEGTGGGGSAAAADAHTRALAALLEAQVRHTGVRQKGRTTEGRMKRVYDRAVRQSAGRIRFGASVCAMPFVSCFLNPAGRSRSGCSALW